MFSMPFAPAFRARTFLSHRDEIAGLRIRFMDPSEAPEVVRIFCRIYGRSYPLDFVYDPGLFSKLARTGRIISAVAVTDANRVVGHAGLCTKPGMSMAKAAVSVVETEYRQSGCQTRMLEFLAGEACRRGFSGIWSNCVTNHTWAQIAGEKAGFKRLALIVGQISANRTYDGICTGDGERKSTALGFLPLTDQGDTVIYAPRHHREFLEMISQEAGLKRCFARPPIGSLISDDPSLIRGCIIDRDQRAVIEIHRYGDDVLTRVRGIMRHLQSKDIEQVTLYLNLGAPLTALVCEEFEELGFFIAGILPRSGGSDALVMQCLNGVHVDYDTILAASDTLAAIKSYVRCHDPDNGCAAARRGDILRSIQRCESSAPDSSELQELHGARRPDSRDLPDGFEAGEIDAAKQFEYLLV